MASVDDFSLNDIQDLFQSFIRRSRMRDGSIADRTQLHLSIDEARMIWAAAKQLSFYAEWGVGVQDTVYELEYCKRFVEELKPMAKEKQMIELDRRGIKVITDVAIHLDRLSILKEERPKSSRKYGGKKR